MKLVVVAGARPNFMKVAPLIEALNVAKQRDPHLTFSLVHTGQHYDERMSSAFFDDLGLPRPDVDLGVGSGSHAEQTGKVMIEFERLLQKEEPDWVVVVGDVNSTMACTIAAKKLGIKVAHVEAGLRSGDRTMPEEINRIVTDVLSDALFTTDPLADDNLKAEGIAAERIHFAGNVMIDSLLKHRDRAEALRYWERLELADRSYGVLTLHRPSNVDNRQVFENILSALEVIQRDVPIAFPVHPRTQKMAEMFGVWNRLKEWPGLRVLRPLSYIEMLSLMSHAAVILTDSGGLQEEAVVLGVSCITLRDNTERPITIAVGANQLVGNNPETILAAVKTVLDRGPRAIQKPDKWDGAAAQRIVDTLLHLG